MNFVKEGKTNWKFLLIVIILAIIIGGGTLWYTKKTEIILNGNADWETYRNEKYGFEFKYPPHWDIKEYFSMPTKGVGGPIACQVPKQESSPLLINLNKEYSAYYEEEVQCGCSIRIFTSLESDEEFNECIEEGFQEAKASSDIEDIKIGETTAQLYFFATGPANFSGVWLLKNNKGFLFYYSALCPQEDCMKIFKQILSTFKFLE